MRPSRPFLVQALLWWASSVQANLQDPTARWFSVPVPGADQAGGYGYSWLGQAEPSDALLEAVTGGGRNLTRLGVDLSDEERSLAQGSWIRRSSSLGMEAVLEGVPGLAFGLQALDLQPKPTLRSDSLQWSVLEPQGGLRLGVAGDLLRPLMDKSPWSLGWSAWFPLYSQNAGFSLQMGLVRGRAFRLDANYAWNDPRTPALLERWRGDSLLADTIEWRTRREVWNLRLGGAWTEGSVAQVWGGRRGLTDPGDDGKSSWRLAGESWFAGAQAALVRGSWEAELESRMETGNASARMDTGPGAGWMADRAFATARSEHLLWDVRGEIRRHLAKPGVSLVLATATNRLHLEGDDPEGARLPLRAGGGATDSWAGSASMGVRVGFKRLSVEPRVGLLRQDLEGRAPSFWWAFPQAEGIRWAAPWQLEGSLTSEGLQGRALYRISGEVPLTDAQGYRAGFRHHIELGQEF